MSDKLNEAYKKALKINENNIKTMMCLSVGICPNCAGENLERYTNDQGFKFSDRHKCPDCGTITEEV